MYYVMFFIINSLVLQLGGKVTLFTLAKPKEK